MSIKPDIWIRRMCEEHTLLTPYLASQVREVQTGHAQMGLAANTEYELHDEIVFRKTISAGTSSYGYDLRLASDSFRVFSPIASAEIDPKNFDEGSLIEAPLRTAIDGAHYWLLPPHSYALGVTIERFNMPANVLAFCVGKSTYARAGLIVNTTPIEPCWRGRLVIELANAADLPIRVYAEEGIAQVTFFEADEACATSYADRAGKYQDQTGIVTAKV